MRYMGCEIVLNTERSGYCVSRKEIRIGNEIDDMRLIFLHELGHVIDHVYYGMDFGTCNDAQVAYDAELRAHRYAYMRLGYKYTPYQYRCTIKALRSYHQILRKS